MKHLVIVESPAKAKTIEKYLGKDYTVRSSFGHIRDLPKKGLSIDKEHDFKPLYEISPDKIKVVKELKSEAKKAGEVWLATDEDREGEAIAWHLCIALGLNPKTTKRIVFHEITKQAILEAIEKPRHVDLQLVDAQQARRVLDRLVGYELSPVLWRKVRAGLSAGRVQSVAVRLIVEREREIDDFESESSFKVVAEFHKGHDFTAELEDRLATERVTHNFLDAVKDSELTVASVDKKPGTRNPSAPFTTSTLQQEAARRLGYSVRQTMTLAQRLYENGHITYMRTDSTNLSGLAIGAAEEYIKKNYGANYHQVRQYKTKSAGAQEAHEAIRPTHFTKETAGHDNQQKKLYNLIWQRALASQMTAANVDRTDVIIDISDRSEKFIAKGEVLTCDGCLKVYGGGKDDTILPDLKVGEKLDPKQIVATETYGRGPARYSEASLVRALEEMGIGRPSTYAPTIGTVQTRGYVEKKDVEGEVREIAVLTLKGKELKSEKQEITVGADKNKLLPTSVALVTNDFLVKYFGPIVDYDFTATAEKEFDDIEEGKTEWNKMIKEFYTKDFVPLVKASADVTREETSQARHLGKDPKSGKPIIARYGRFGPMLQKGETSDDEKPHFAPMPEGIELEDITLKEALPMFELPRAVGTTDKGEPIEANIGRFGPYVKVGKMFVSIKELSPFHITEKEARELIKEKEKQIAERNVADFGTIKILRGPYGPYVTDGKKNARIDKETDPTKLTEAQAKKILAEAPEKKGFRRGGFKKAGATNGTAKSTRSKK